MMATPVDAPADQLETNIPARQPFQSGQTLQLSPGQWLFGRSDCSVSCILRDGIALIGWHPSTRLGFICVEELNALDEQGGNISLRFVQQLVDRYLSLGLDPSEVVWSVVGGAHTGQIRVPQQGLFALQQWLGVKGMHLAQQDVGGSIIRKLTFRFSDGQLSVAHGGRMGHLQS